MENLKYLKLLSEQYPNIPAVSTEIINLKAILNLPKSSEHFLTDLHGEYESFQHMLRTASGLIKFKIDEIFSSHLSNEEKNELATIIFYPEEKLKTLNNKDELSTEWYATMLKRIIKICKRISSKYTRSKVRKALPDNFSYIIEELLHLKENDKNKQGYRDQIIATIIDIGQAENFIISLSDLIQTFAVDKLHIIGDIFDRGPNPHKIIDTLKEHHNCDIQWGNHDILWMGAALGQKSLLATAIRTTLRYGNLKLLEEGYGINMRPLARLARSFYQDDPCTDFTPHLINKTMDDKDKKITAQMQKAIAIIQFKLEGNLIKRRSEFAMNEALYLDKIDYEKGTIHLNNQEYKLTASNFPTIDPENPYQLHAQEKEVIKQLSNSFKNNDKLQSHIRFLFNHGSMYLKYNGNLLFHGCIPLTEKGDFAAMEINGQQYQGKKLLDFFEDVIRKSYSYQFETTDHRDWLWYLWRGELSPLFGKDKMTTFSRYFIPDESLHQEEKNPYYQLREKENVCKKILSEFNLNSDKGYIINGHTPVKEKKGETPIKSKGKLLVIDGGISAAYQQQTGIAGYTLIYNSSEMRLISHKPFVSRETAIAGGNDVISSMRVVELDKKEKIADTDIGVKLKNKIENLMELLHAYKKGLIKEKYD